MWRMVTVIAVLLLSIFAVACETIRWETPRDPDRDIPMGEAAESSKSNSEKPRRSLRKEPYPELAEIPNTRRAPQPGFMGKDAEALESPTILEVWKGEVSMKASRRATPYGAVENADDWRTTWRALRPTERVPEVDFSRDMVLVAFSGNPNHIMVSRMTLKPDGNLQVQYKGTLMAFRNRNSTSTRYALTRIRRRGIRLVNGVSPKPLPDTPPGIAAPFPEANAP